MTQTIGINNLKTLVGCYSALIDSSYHFFERKERSQYRDEESLHLEVKILPIEEVQWMNQTIVKGWMINF